MVGSPRRPPAPSVPLTQAEVAAQEVLRYIPDTASVEVRYDDPLR